MKLQFFEEVGLPGSLDDRRFAMCDQASRSAVLSELARRVDDQSLDAVMKWFAARPAIAAAYDKDFSTSG